MHRLGPLQDKERLLNHYQQLRNATEVDIAALANKIEIISNIWQCVSTPELSTRPGDACTYP